MQFDEELAHRPSLRTWIKHTILFLLTLLATTLAGILFPFGSNYSPLFELETFFDSYWKLLAIPFVFNHLLILGLERLFSDFAILKHGLTFSIPLLFILTAHEFGHYIACRIYRVEATLPYFLPVPILSPAGTFGAFIRILSPMPSRRSTFDIGVAGPIAGFIAIIPVVILAFLTMEQITPAEAANLNADLVLSDPLLVKFFAYIFGFDLNLVKANGFYFAAWVGLLVTSLNLVPSGQLDGGHAVYAVFGAKFHNLTGKVAFAVMVLMTTVGWFVFNSPSGLLFTILLGIMLKIRHPEPFDDSPLDLKRKIIALITLVIFILSFAPFPIQINP